MDTLSDLLAWNDHDDVATSTARAPKPSRPHHRRFLSGSSDFFSNPDTSFFNLNSSSGNSKDPTGSSSAPSNGGAAAGTAAAAADTAAAASGGTGSSSANLDSNKNNSFFANLLPSAKSNLNNQIYDKLMEKMVLMALPSADTQMAEASIQQRLKDSSSRPQFSVQTLTKNFIDLNSRLSVPFTSINNVIKIFDWESPFFNIFILILLSNLILNPVSWLLSFPFLFLAFGIMVPQYLQKYPLDSINYQTLYHVDVFPFPSYMPLQQPTECKPCNQISKEFFLNLTDLQNFMIIYALIWDFLNTLLSKFIYFKVESLSNFIFVSVVAMAALSFKLIPSLLNFISPFLKIVLISLLWSLMIMIHPKYRDKLIQILQIDQFIATELQKFDINDGRGVDANSDKDNISVPQSDEGKDNKTGFEDYDKLQENFANNNNDNTNNSASNEDTTEVINHAEEGSPDVSKMIKNNQITKIISKKVNKQKVLTNISFWLQKQIYIKFINDEFNYDLYLKDLSTTSTIADHCVLDSSNCKAYQLIEIFELQSFNRIENEWKESIFSPDHFTVNSTIRKLVRVKLKPRRKSDKLKSLFNSNSDSKSQSKPIPNDTTTNLDIPPPSQPNNTKSAPTSSPSIYSLSSLLTSPNYDSDTSFFGNQQNSGGATGISGQTVSDYDSLKPKIFSTSLNLIKAPKNYKFMYPIIAESSTMNPNTAETNESANTTSIMKDTINNLHLQSSYASSSWKLDLLPTEWCNKNYITEVVDIDEDTKWVYDKITNDVDVKFRRRRWIRMVERISEYDDDDDDI